MNHRKPDFTSYTLAELESARKTLGRHEHPEQLAEVELLIRDRKRQANRRRSVPRTPLTDSRDRIASTKPGRAASLGGGILQILVALLFGWFWVNFDIPFDSGFPFLAFGLLVVTAGVASGAYQLYNAFARNRFTEQDFLAPGAEPDPLSRALGYENDRDTDS